MMYNNALLRHLKYMLQETHNNLISPKEIMLSVALVCVSVCLSVSNISKKNMNRL